MGYVIVSFLPLIIASALVPAQIILYLLILKSPEQNLLKASAFVGGKIVVRLLQGLIFGLILSNSAAATAYESGGKSPVAMLLLPIILSHIIPRQVDVILEQVSTWMNRNMRPITIGVSLFLGFSSFTGAPVDC